ncbi:MAG: glycosyltransferase family 2 protein [Pikeienuella sp.]
MNDESIMPLLISADTPVQGRLGTILQSETGLSEQALANALAAQQRSGVRLGEIFAAQGTAPRQDITAALARQRGLPYVDLTTEAPDPAFFNPDDAALYLDNKIMPLRIDGGRVNFVTTDAETAQQALRRLRPNITSASISLGETRAFHQLVTAAAGPQLALRAAEARAKGDSLRAGFCVWQRLLLLALIAGGFTLALSAPNFALATMLMLATLVIGTNGTLWAIGLFRALSALRTPAKPPAPPLPTHARRPKITLLIPLYREPETAPALIAALSALDYPPELLDVKLILEQDDVITAKALNNLSPPPFIEVLIAPTGAPQTKPRALNFAMDFVSGDIIGIYDAEDRPPSDQLQRIVAQFAAAPPTTVCIQARLGFYNSRENWLSRMFELEYASWFDIMLPNLRRMGLPIPLGGTSLFIKRAALAEVGGWDSHNVTEDADLGMLLARKGYNTDLSDSLTSEEANCRVNPWIKQRSRWLKGYMATWLTHMRAPHKLLAALGVQGFIGLNVILLASVVSNLALPWLWGLAVVQLIGGWVPQNSFIAFGLVSLNMTVVIFLPVMLGIATLAAWGRGWRTGAYWALTAPLYWPLSAIAAYMALVELFVAPFKWRKTQHGISQMEHEEDEPH